MIRSTFSGEVWEWRGPAPFYFVSLPEALANEVADVAETLTYGWGMIPGRFTIGETTWDTAMFQKGGTYVLPLKAAVRKLEGIEPGESVTVTMLLGSDGVG